jgi:hypothetical protein
MIQPPLLTFNYARDTLSICAACRSVISSMPTPAS